MNLLARCILIHRREVIMFEKLCLQTLMCAYSCNEISIFDTEGQTDFVFMLSFRRVPSLLEHTLVFYFVN